MPIYDYRGRLCYDRKLVLRFMAALGTALCALPAWIARPRCAATAAAAPRARGITAAYHGCAPSVAMIVRPVGGGLEEVLSRVSPAARRRRARKAEAHTRAAQRKPAAIGWRSWGTCAVAAIGIIAAAILGVHRVRLRDDLPTAPGLPQVSAAP